MPENVDRDFEELKVEGSEIDVIKEENLSEMPNIDEIHIDVFVMNNSTMLTNDALRYYEGE